MQVFAKRVKEGIALYERGGDVLGREILVVSIRQFHRMLAGSDRQPTKDELISGKFAADLSVRL